MTTTTHWPSVPNTITLHRVTRDGVCPYCRYYYSADFSMDVNDNILLKHNCLVRGQSFGLILGANEYEATGKLNEMHQSATAVFVERMKEANRGNFADMWVQLPPNGVGQVVGDIVYATSTGKGKVRFEVQFSMKPKAGITLLTTNRLIRFMQNFALRCGDGNAPLDYHVSLYIQNGQFDVGGYIEWRMGETAKFYDFTPHSVYYSREQWWGWQEIGKQHLIPRLGKFVGKLGKLKPDYIEGVDAR